MKKLIFVTLIAIAALLCTVPVMSQTFFYKLHTFAIWEIDEEEELTENRAYEELTGVVSMDEEQSKLVIDLPNKKLLFTLLERIKTEKRYDGDGDEYIRYHYTAVDDEVIRCMVIIDDYAEYSDTHFYIKYSDMIIMYMTTFVQYKEKEEKKSGPPQNSPTRSSNTRATYTML